MGRGSEEGEWGRAGSWVLSAFAPQEEQYLTIETAIGVIRTEAWQQGQQPQTRHQETQLVNAESWVSAQRSAT